MPLKITLIYAGLLGLFYIFLSFNVISKRRSMKVGLGHSTDQTDPLFKAVRIHANFSEFVPLVVLMLALDEVTGRAAGITHALGASLVAARVLHYQGITQSHGKSFGRASGAVITNTVLIVLSVLLIIKGVA